MNILDRQVGQYQYARPGHWNDPDMLEVGNGGMTTTEYKTHFSMWAMLAAPLIAGNDLRHMNTASKRILEDKEVIAVDQDPAGHQACKLIDHGPQEVWVEKMADGSRVVALLNRGPKPAFMTTSAQKMGLSQAKGYKLRNLWKHENQTTKDLIRAKILPHGIAMFRIWAR